MIELDEPEHAYQIDDTVPRLIEGSLVPHTMDVESQFVPCTDCGPQFAAQAVASFVVEFRGMTGAINHGLRLRLENRVRDSELGQWPEGHIYFYRWTGSAPGWIEMPIRADQEMGGNGYPDDWGTANGTAYRYWSPEDPPVNSQWFGMERDFRWSADRCAGFVSDDGRVKVKVLLKQHPTAFTVKWDLVQLAWTSDIPVVSASAGEPEGEAAGANVNYDGFTDSNDVVTFLDAYGQASAAADFNQDGAVDGVDVLEFAHAFEEGGTP